MSNSYSKTGRLTRHSGYTTSLFAWGIAALLLGGCATVSAASFSFDDVIKLAKERAAKDYVAPATIPDFMQNLSYDEYRSIHFDEDDSLWRASGSKFQVQLRPAGMFYRKPVQINVLDSTGVHPLTFERSKFHTDNTELAKRIPADLGYAGFSLTYPINNARTNDQFLTFAGASYFRAVDKGDQFGISARGLAIDTGLLSGEEFPDFVSYWLERPAKNADAMRVYALLDSPRVAGAYQFAIYPGAPTKIQVKMVLFLRKDIDLLGVAPLTSMFYYGENTSRPLGQWRPEVHDSDGLLIQNGTGEWIWNPVLNPKALQMQSFGVNNVTGFGLLQRDRNFSNYQDAEALYDQRPSAWIAPRGDWGQGRIVLVEIPTTGETNDNLVAFWAPPKHAAADKPWAFEYEMSFGDPTLIEQPVGHVVNTFVGRDKPSGGDKPLPTYRILVDFAGGPLDKLKADDPVNVDLSAQQGGKVLDSFLTYVPTAKCWRLSLLARSADGKALALRAFLKKDGDPLSETWTYSLPAQNSIVGEER